MKTRFDEKIRLLREKKLEQTSEKIEKEGLLDEDDYGRVAPSRPWNIIPNHPDGSFYGTQGWKENFRDIMENHPVYVDPNDAFAGRWMYFMSKMRPNIWNPAYPYDHLKGNIEKYNIIDGIGYDAHFAPDFRVGLELGWEGLLGKIRKYKDKAKNDPVKVGFYEAHETAIKAVQSWIKNTIEEIKEKIDKEKDPECQQNLIEMLEVNEHVLHEAPRTFRQACQWIIWFHLASRTYNRDGAGGQLDELLRPYYEKDLAEGTLDDEKAVYYLACFLINDPVYWQLGGPDENGEDMVSRVSYLVLEAADKINTSLNLTVRVHDGLDETFFKKAVHYLVKNKNAWPRFSGDKALVQGFVQNGYSNKLARQRIAVGCNWMSLPGMEYTMNDLVKVNLAKVFEISFQEMMDKKVANSTETLWNIFNEHLNEAVHTAAECIRHQLKYQQFNEPELLLNLLSHGPIEKGLDASAGGAMYYNLAIDGAGLATVADSFAALEQRVEKEKRKDWKEIHYHMLENFIGIEGGQVQALMQTSQRYGQGASIGDKWAKKINQAFCQHVLDERRFNKKHVFIPGWFSWANTVEFGQKVGATPNGRKAGEPISHGANPHPGFSKDGASIALSNAIASVQPGYGNTAPMQWELDPFFSDADYEMLIASIIKTHFELGGTLINVNIVDKSKVLEAHRDPSKYPDLIVRVTGFTAYFAMLTPEFRQLVVDRILEN
jgi:formate C-acetyltransferase